ncbi:MAG: hypothetical protein JWQ38_1751 [Flavipsychrobacter sp.]|nr:hypothetical protein [Flavipsychrobacter sp.]
MKVHFFTFCYKLMSYINALINRQLVDTAFLLSAKALLQRKDVALSLRLPYYLPTML